MNYNKFEQNKNRKKVLSPLDRKALMMALHDCDILIKKAEQLSK